ncbi:MAG: hypothetical protein M3375_05555, partial [Actinomycetota bacterium]|nr:hypothetical protein [Actinomycetota bacterium]
PRASAACGRVVRVLLELDLVEVGEGAEPLLRVTDSPRTELERSAAYRAYAARLDAAESWLTRGGALAA